MMAATDVLEVVDLLGGAGIAAWLDGGWGVDALLGAQSRDHDDLDLVLSLADAAAVKRLLGAAGFAVTEDERTRCFVARDAADRRVDVHTVEFDGAGVGWQLLEDGGRWRYPPAGFAGVGAVGGRAVACLSPETQVRCHTGYQPDDGDRRDVRLLAERFGLALPPPYAAPR